LSNVFYIIYISILGGVRFGMFRILYASDLHGSTLMFKKLVNASTMYGADAIIVGGDITGKGIVPVVKAGESYYAIIYGSRYEAKSKDELNKLLEKIAEYGFYPHMVEDPSELARLDQEQYFERLINEYMEKRLQEWAEYARRKLSGRKIGFYIMPGNDDPYYIDEVLGRIDIFTNHDNRIITIGRPGEEYILAGYAKANITPWKCSRDVDEEVLRKELHTLLTQIDEYDKLILNTHCPPYNTTLDLAPMLDKDLKPIVSGGSIVYTHVGCVSVREIIEKYQPLLGLHGHIHESRGIEKIGRTTIVNPGSAYNEGVLYATLIILDKGRLKSISMIKG